MIIEIKQHCDFRVVDNHYISYLFPRFSKSIGFNFDIIYIFKWLKYAIIFNTRRKDENKAKLYFEWLENEQTKIC